MNPAIVVVAHDRPVALSRLLHALETAHYNGNPVPLIFSIDHSGSDEVETLVRSFKWSHGPVTVEVKKANLGLKAHMLTLGDWLEVYDSIIVLEDDVLVSPWFYQFANRAIPFYASDDRIAGVSLYSYTTAENGFYPFQPIADGADVYFMQVASSWGQAWTKAQWKGFTDWLEQQPEELKSAKLPGYLMHWSSQSWKKLFIAYLFEKERFFVFPRVALSTNFEDHGTHASHSGLYQVPLQSGATEWRLVTLDESAACYDAWFEILPEALNKHTSTLKDYNYSVDFYGEKTPEQCADFVLTSNAGKGAVLNFSGDMRPLLLNVIYRIEGNAIGLFPTDQFPTEKKLQGWHHSNRSIGHELFRKYPLAVGIVIYVAEQHNALNETLDSLVLQHYDRLTVKILTPSGLANQVEKLAKDKLLKTNITYQLIPTGGEPVMEWLASSFRDLQTDVVCWLNAGSTLAEDCLRRVNLIFSDFQNISWITGVSDQREQLPVRWTEWLLHNHLTKVKTRVTTELMFFKPHVWSQEVSNETAALMAMAASHIPHATAMMFGQRTIWNEPPGLPEEELKSAMEHNVSLVPSAKAKMIAAMMKLLKGKQVTWSSHHYIIAMHLPDVLRYDEANDSFYLSRI